MEMRPVLLAVCLLLVSPVALSFWTVGNQLVMDPMLVCKKTRRLKGKLGDICRKEPALLKQITKGMQVGTKECQYQFRNRRWNCTTYRRSLKKIILRDSRRGASQFRPFSEEAPNRRITRAHRARVSGLRYFRLHDYSRKFLAHHGLDARVPCSSSSSSVARGSVTGRAFGGLLISAGLRDTRETGFVNAITAAGVTYAVTRACTMGDLVECSCEKMTPKSSRYGKLGRLASRSKHLPTDGDWEWGGCGDNVNFGFKKSREFMDAPYRRRSDIKTLLKRHNNDAGRLAVRNFMRTECKCHGLSGSCTVRTCWRKMPPFREVGNRLKESFDGAAKVIPGNDGHSFITEGLTIKPPGRFDLIYSEDSPDFCRANRKTGALGTQGRQCNATSQGVDGCELLCCGRGYDTRIIKEKVNCQCRFRWCCDVTCNTCIVKKTLNTCR